MIEWLGKSLDSLIYQISPERGNLRTLARLRRERADVMRERALASGGYASAENSKDGHSWLKSRLSPDSALESDRPEMILRADSAVKNYELGTAHVEGRVNRVASCGMTVDPDIQAIAGKITEAQAQQWNRELRSLWERTAERIGRHGEELWQIQHLLQRYWETRGEWFVLIGDKYDPLAPTTLKIEVLEPDQILTPPQKEGDPYCRMGVQMSPKGEILGYWYREHHEGDDKLVKDNWTFYPAFYANGLPRVIHMFAKWKKGQHRGFPLMQVGTKRLKNSEEYAEAELERNWVAACHAAFVYSDVDPDVAQASQGVVTESDGTRTREITPGMIHYAGLTDRVDFSNPQGAPASFDPFMEYEARMFAAGAGTSYEILTNTWKGISYSAGRIIWNIEDQTTKVLQMFHAVTVKAVYRHFISRCVTSGQAIEVEQSAYRSEPWNYWPARLIAPAKASVDPAREDRNDLVLAEAGVVPLSNIVEKKNGQPADKVYARVRRDREDRAQNGLEIHMPQMGRDAEVLGTGRAPDQPGDPNPESSDANSDRQEIGVEA